MDNDSICLHIPYEDSLFNYRKQNKIATELFQGKLIQLIKLLISHLALSGARSPTLETACRCML